MSFVSLGLSDELLKAVAEHNYTKPYPIQDIAIPAILSGKDIFGLAQTGSGKTASFALPILQLMQQSRSAKSRHVKVLVLVPTRELAVQVAEVFQQFSIHLSNRPKTLAVYGGVSINPQMMQMQGTDILVATPGRLLDLISSNSVHLSSVEVLVLDEADKMLNLGFKEEMNQLFALLPKRRQNLLFSATTSEDVNEINSRLLSEPVKIEVKPEQQNLDLITQVAYHVSDERKGVMLRYLIKQKNMTQVLVFVSSTHRADHVVVKLKKNGIDAMSLHSKKSQGARTEALSRFKTGKLRVLVATDLASRGIDVQFLPYVINYELPRSPNDYVHRIGRTGRAESPGEAISLITPEDQHHFKIIQKKMKKQVPILETDQLDLHGY
jgi:ATP-dependent RNA helicase RhlE